MLEMRICLNLKPTTNDVYCGIFLLFRSALPTFSFGKLILFFIIENIFPN